MEERKVLTLILTQAAKELNISRPTMTNLVHRADFPSFRVGRRWIIPADGLKRWLEEQVGLACEERAG